MRRYEQQVDDDWRAAQQPPQPSDLTVRHGSILQPPQQSDVIDLASSPSPPRPVQNRSSIQHGGDGDSDDDEGGVDPKLWSKAVATNLAFRCVSLSLTMPPIVSLLAHVSLLSG